MHKKNMFVLLSQFPRVKLNLLTLVSGLNSKNLQNLYYVSHSLVCVCLCVSKKLVPVLLVLSTFNL